jgi:hypothetical protein
VKNASAEPELSYTFIARIDKYENANVCHQRFFRTESIVPVYGSDKLTI